MKPILFCLSFFLFSAANGFSQAVAEFKVAGNCGMCENRIETALDVKGVKSADWNVETKMVSVKYNPEKITEQELMKLVAAAGHDTEKAKADNVVYNNLHGCCQYPRIK